MAVPVGAAFSQSAQSPQRWSLRADNDAFDFWMQPFNRPDDEYTSGVHIDYEGGAAPRWSRALLHAGPACTTATTTCGTARFEIGQDMYTPDVSVGASHAALGSRPNAGWLYASQTAHALTESKSSELSLTFGVTGPPSLAQYTQQLAHRIAPAFNRPTDWSRQIGFEPGVIGRYELRDRVWSGSAGAFGADIVPRAAASVGNVLTSADAGLDVRIGHDLSHPWLPSRTRGLEIALLAGTGGSAVARNLFLDGNTFRAGPRVGHEPLVASGDIGLLIKYRSIDFTYRAQSDSRAYPGGPKWHPWSTLAAGFTAWSGV